MLTEDELRQILREVEDGKTLTPAEAKLALDAAALLIWQAACQLESSRFLPSPGLDSDDLSEVVEILAETCVKQIQEQLMGSRHSLSNGWRLDTELSAFVRSRFRGILSNWRKRRQRNPVGSLPKGQDGEPDTDLLDRMSCKATRMAATSWNAEQRTLNRDLLRKAITVISDPSRTPRNHALAYGLAKGLHGEATSIEAIRAYAAGLGAHIPVARIRRAKIKVGEDGFGLDLDSVAALLDVSHESVRKRVRATEKNLREQLA
jgi:hypothetical protein